MKPIIAIAHADNSGIGYELIFKTFSTPEMLDICTPIVYGSSADAKSCLETLDIEATFSVVSTAKDAMHGKINLVEVNAEDIKVRIDTDFKACSFAALVAVPAKKDMWQTESSFNILLNQRMRMTIAPNDVEKRIEGLNLSLKQDFRILQPRIAVISSDAEMSAAISLAREKHVLVYGPFVVEEFFANAYYENFDAILTTEAEQSYTQFGELSIEASCEYTAGMSMVKTSADDVDSFRQAVYAAIDITRNRKNYQEPLANPLPKLFHEKKDDGERLRFNVPSKKKEE